MVSRVGVPARSDDEDEHSPGTAFASNDTVVVLLTASLRRQQPAGQAWYARHTRHSRHCLTRYHPAVALPSLAPAQPRWHRPFPLYKQPVQGCSNEGEQRCVRVLSLFWLP